MEAQASDPEDKDEELQGRDIRSTGFGAKNTGDEEGQGVTQGYIPFVAKGTQWCWCHGMEGVPVLLRDWLH